MLGDKPHLLISNTLLLGGNNGPYMYTNGVVP